jgi:hypothetical protein
VPNLDSIGPSGDGDIVVPNFDSIRTSGDDGWNEMVLNLDSIRPSGDDGWDKINPEFGLDYTKW